MTQVTDEMVERALTVNTDLVQGFTYATRHVIRDFRAPLEGTEIWSGPLGNHREMMKRLEFIKMRDVLTAALAEHVVVPISVPVAWQWRACIGGRWGSWLHVDQPIERFSERNAFNLDNGTYELRPLYAVTRHDRRDLEEALRIIARKKKMDSTAAASMRAISVSALALQSPKRHEGSGTPQELGVTAGETVFKCATLVIECWQKGHVSNEPLIDALVNLREALTAQAAT